MSSEREAFNDGFDKGFNKALDKIAQLKAENEVLIKAHWEQMAETDYCYVCGEHGYNHPNKKCLLARKETPCP